MKKSFFSVLTAVILSIAVNSCTAPKETAVREPAKEVKPITSTFKMLSINTSHQLRDAGDVKKFAQWVKSTGAEIVAVQQIERATDIKPGFDAVMELTKKLDMRSTFAKARYLDGWDSGNALLCMYPLLQSDVFMLPVGKGKIRRSLSFGVFEMGLKSIAFASTELDESDHAERANQVAEILELQSSMKEYPIVVAGNFGESAKGKTTSRLLGKYLSVNETAVQTAPLTQQIFVPRERSMNILSAEKVSYKPFSQNGVLVTIEVVQ